MNSPKPSVSNCQPRNTDQLTQLDDCNNDPGLSSPTAPPLMQLQDTARHDIPSEDSFTTLIPVNISTTDFPSSDPLPQPRIIPIERSPLLPRALLPPAYQISGSLSSACIGSQLDASADGLIIIAALSSLVGILIWWIFSVIRPRFRSIYALREWFVHPDLRPKPLTSSLLAFLRPNVPLYPSFPLEVPRAGHSVAEDSQLFPSDEQLSQRFLWVAFLITSCWSAISLGGALPMYIVNIPCGLAKIAGTYGGTTPILLELSILRLLRMFDIAHISTQDLISLGQDAAHDPLHVRIRIIVVTALALGVGLLPVIYLVLKEFNKLVEHRRRWIEEKCQGNELGWLSASAAPGFVGWGEQRIKKFIISSGLSSTLDPTEQGNGIQSKRRRGSRRRRLHGNLSYVEEATLEVDIQMLFSIGDTQHLARLIDERDAILEDLEIAETKYIKSFRITTPDPSVLDFELSVPPPNPNRPYISLPLPLGTHTRQPRGRRALNRALASSSFSPTSFVAPSQYYKLRHIHAVSARFTESRESEKGKITPRPRPPEPSFSDAFNSRIVGSRFFEVNRNSGARGHIPLGSPLTVDETGQLVPSEIPDDYLGTIPDPRLYGPNYVPETASWDDRIAHQLGLQTESYAGVTTETDENQEDGWVDIARTAPVNFGDDYYQELPQSVAGPSFLAGLPGRPRPPKKLPPLPPPSDSRRETFPLRQPEGPKPVTPPHMRLQPSQPFVRPLEGISFNELSEVYANITHWRSHLKAINAEIEELQKDSYNDIADGVRIKGWLLVGRGLNHIPGVELIEGRAKEDIRWDVLQSEPGPMDAVVLWGLIGVIVFLLAVGLTAASGLSLAMVPDVAHFLSFLKPLLRSNGFASGAATLLAPSVAVIIFALIAFTIIDWAIVVYGYICISGTQLFLLKTAFYLSLMVVAWLTTASAFLSSVQAFNTDEAQVISIANGSISASILMLAIVAGLAIISPGLLLLQPIHVWRVIRAQRDSITPRQKFRALCPLTYNPSFALGACIFALVSASTFWLILPLIAPVVAILISLTLVAHRYLVGYIYARTRSQTGGLYHIWLLKRLGTTLSLQPVLLGLIFLSRRLWIEGGVLLGSAMALVLLVEAYAGWKTRSLATSYLSAITQDSVTKFSQAATDMSRSYLDGQDTIGDASGRGTRVRESMASVLDMMSITLAVTPAQFQGAVPLRTETIDDLTATETAARTHPDAPPHLPPLSFTEHADDMAGVLYVPELIAPPPIIWLPNDSAGVARSEAADLRKYHDLRATIDVCEPSARRHHQVIID